MSEQIKTNNGERLFDEDPGNHIAIVIRPDGTKDFFADYMNKNHAQGLPEYFEEHIIDEKEDKEHFLPKPLSNEEVKNTIFKKANAIYKRENNGEEDFYNDNRYANYLIKFLNNQGYILIKDYTPYKMKLSSYVVIDNIYLPQDPNQLTKEQIDVLKDINARAYDRNINVNCCIYDSYEQAVLDRTTMHNLNEIIYKEEDDYVQTK